MKRVVGILVSLCAASVCAAGDFSVDFTGCIESIGVGLVSTDTARGLVPAEFVLAGEGTPVTPEVVRTSRCDGIGVGGEHAKRGIVVQIGLVVVPPDFTGDINNYTLWYYTSDGKLAQQLKQAGVAAQWVPGLVDVYVPAIPGDSDPLAVLVPPPGLPTLSVGGHVSASTVPAGSFEANWWAQAGPSRVKMDTDVPTIFIGTANLTLVTDASNDLGHLLGGGIAQFPVLQQFNTFSNAHMTVTVTP